MITITEQKNKITVSGHANHAEKGKDVVCAAVTALTYCLAWSLEDLTETITHCDTRPGMTVIEIENQTADAQLLIDSFFIGVEGVQSTNPECVEINRPSIEGVKSYGEDEHCIYKQMEGKEPNHD